MKSATVMCVLTLVFTYGNGYKILGLFPYPGKSHFDFFEPLLKALAEKGHEVSVISHFPQKSPTPNYTDININSESEFQSHAINMGDFTGARYEKYLTPLLIAYFGYDTCRDALSHGKVQDLVKSQPHFDLIIMEFFNNPCFLGVTHKLKAPVIGVSSCTVMPWHDALLASFSNPSFIPNHFLPFSDQMTYFERVENTVLYLFHSLVYKLLMDWPSNWIAKEYLGDDLPDLGDIALNTSLMIVNNHFSYTLPRPMAPGYIEVAGLHIGKPNKLPQSDFIAQ